jgi:hypothetical protein
MKVVILTGPNLAFVALSCCRSINVIGEIEFSNDCCWWLILSDRSFGSLI